MEEEIDVENDVKHFVEDDVNAKKYSSKQKLIEDIKDLKNKLLFVATNDIITDMHGGKNIAETQRKGEVRKIRNILKGKIITFDMIERAEQIIKNGEPKI